MAIPLKVLIIEDSDSDAALDVRVLEKAGYKIAYEVVTTAGEMKAALDKQTFDLIISDHKLPQFDSLQALALLRESEQDIPFIVVSGTIGEETAVQVMKAGAQDYIMKNNLHRLGAAVERELREVKIRRESKQMQNALKESEEKYRDLVERASDGICIIQDRLVKYANMQLGKIWGGAAEEIIDTTFTSHVHPDELPRVADLYNRRMTGEQLPSIYETALRRKDGSKVEVELNVGVITYKEKPAELVVIRDITERKRAEKALVESEEKYRLLTESSLTGIYIIQDGKYAFVNDRFAKMHGYKATEMLGIEHLTLVHPDKRDFVRKIHAKLFNGEQAPVPIVGQRLTKSGEAFWAEIIICAIEYRGKPSIMGNLVDITERRKAEDALNEKTRFTNNLINAIGDPVFVKDNNSRFILTNNALCDMLGIEREKIIGKTLGESLPEDQMEHFLEIDKMVLKSGQENLCEEPLTGKNGDILTIVTRKTRYVDEKGNRFLVGVIRDITERKHSEEALKQSYQKLQKTIESTIQTVALTAETRDPYTAGHQRRVAKLARAIAEEIGLAKDTIEGVYVAGILHDIGKINVPSEILSKPGKLSELEMSLIKTHSRVGYDIVKTLALPWQICPAVLQHHERMDGSGYPSGISGEDIDIEARIIAVADVVEAMASHRPYRSALGIDKALEEITRNRGKLYDPDVADACVRLFKEKGFKIE